MEEEQSPGAAGGGEDPFLQDVEVKKENPADEVAPEAEEEDEDSLPHSEVLDIFEEGLARLVQDPLLCDLPIQVSQPL